VHKLWQRKTIQKLFLSFNKNWWNFQTVTNNGSKENAIGHILKGMHVFKTNKTVYMDIRLKRTKMFITKHASPFTAATPTGTRWLTTRGEFRHGRTGCPKWPKVGAGMAARSSLPRTRGRAVNLIRNLCVPSFARKWTKGFQFQGAKTHQGLCD